MSFLGAGLGPQYGGLPHPSIEDQRQTAAQAYTKEFLGQIKDTLSIPFYELGGQLGRYPSDPSKPTLAPLSTSRGVSGLSDKQNTDWQGVLENLVNRLPDAVKNDYQAEMALPLDQRNLNFVALDNVLSWVAAGIAWMGRASLPTTTEGIQAEDRVINKALPYVAISQLSSMGTLTMNKATDYLNALGANYPQHDALQNQVREANQSLDQLQELYVQANPTTPTPVPVEKYSALAEKAIAASEQYQRTNSQGDLSIVGDTLNSIAFISSSLALDSIVSPAFFIALTLSNIGINTQTSQTGMISPELNELTKGFAANFSSTTLAKADAPTQKLLEMYVQSALFGATVLGTLINSSALGYIPQNDPQDAEKTQQFSTQLAFSMAVHSGVVESTISALVNTFGLVAAQQEPIQAAIELLALNTLMSATTAKTSRENSALLESIQTSANRKIEQLEDSINREVNDGNILSDAQRSTGIALGQAKAALLNNDAESFQQAISLLFNFNTTSGENNEGQFKQLNESISMIIQSLSGNISELKTNDTQINLIA